LHDEEQQAENGKLSYRIHIVAKKNPCSYLLIFVRNVEVLDDMQWQLTLYSNCYLIVFFALLDPGIEPRTV